MREKFARFMAGRYGMDSLGRFTMALTLIFIVMNYFTTNKLVPLLAWAGIILTYFRMFSKNTYKRSAEPTILTVYGKAAPLVLHTEEYFRPEKDPPYLQVSFLQAENSDSQRKRPY